MATALIYGWNGWEEVDTDSPEYQAYKTGHITPYESEFYGMQLEDSLSAVFGDPDVGRFVEALNTKPDEIAETLYSAGKNDYTNAIFEALKFNPKEVEQFYTPQEYGIEQPTEVPERFVQPVDTAELNKIFQQLYPEQATGDIESDVLALNRYIEAIRGYAERNTSQFLADIRQTGRTPETEALLTSAFPELLYTDIETIFGEGEEAAIIPQPTTIEEVDFNVLFEKTQNMPWWKNAISGSMPFMPLALEETRDYLFALGKQGLEAVARPFDKYVNRPWEGTILAYRALFQKYVFNDKDAIAYLDRVDELDKKYGAMGIFADETAELMESYKATQMPEARYAVTAAEFANPVYWIPVGGAFGKASSLTTKIPVLGRTMRYTAAGIQATERGIAEATLLPTVGRLTVKGAEAIGKRLGESYAERLIKQSPHLIMEIPTSEMLEKGLLVDNWMRRSIQLSTKLPIVGGAIKGGVEKSLGWRILVNRESQLLEDIIGRGATVYGAIERMGLNARNVEIMGLRSIEQNPVKFFGFNKSGYSQMMADRILPEYATANAGTLEHVFSNPWKYDWAGIESGLEYAARINEINKSVLALLEKEGVPPEHLMDDWIHRVVTGKAEVEVKGIPGRTGRAIGKKPSYEKPRTFKTMNEGIEAGIRYDPNIENSVGTYIEEAFKKIGNSRLSKYVEQFGSTPTERLAEAYPGLIEKFEAAKTRLADAAKFNSLLNRAARGERIPSNSIDSIARTFPDEAKELKELIPHLQEKTPQIGDRFIELQGRAKLALQENKLGYYKIKVEKAAKMELARQPHIGEGYLVQPFAGGKIYSQEFIDTFNKFFGYEKGLGVLKVTSDVAGILRITKAALDFSAMMIQGLPSFGLAHSYFITNPKVGTRLMGAWYNAFGHSVASFFNPDVFAGYMARNKDIALNRIAMGGSSRAVDYFTALEVRSGVGGKAQWALEHIPLKPFQRAETSFFSAGEVVRNEFWKILSPKAIANGKEFELARHLDLITGLAESKGMGVPMTVRQLEQSFAWFAPNYTRACLTVVGDIFRGGYTGAMAKKALGGMLAAGASYYTGIQYAISTLNGKSDEEAWRDVLNGMGIKVDPITGDVSWQPSANFMTVKVGNYNMGAGGFWYGLVRLAGNITATIGETGDRERVDLIKIFENGDINKDNPFVYWWYTRSSPLVGVGFDISTGKDFLGYPIETPQEYARYILTRFEPIWMEQGLNWMIPGLARDVEVPEGNARAVVPVAEVFGLRTFPDSAWVNFYDKANKFIPQIPEDELDQLQLEAWRNGTLGWKQLTDMQRMNLLNRYPELEELYSKAQADSAVRQSKEWEAYTTRVEEERKVYIDRLDELTRQLLNGEIDTREYREKAGEAGMNYGSILDAMQRDPTYSSIYEYFDAQEAKGDKYGFQDNIALDEYQSAILYAEDLTLPNGDYDWNERDRRVDAFIDKWGQGVYDRVQIYLSQKKDEKNVPEIWIRKSEDTEKLGRGYWRLPYKPIGEMDETDLADGNIPDDLLPLWKEYQANKTDEFLEQHPELTKDYRAEYRASHPEDDARLALWGYGGKLQSMEAYNLVEQWGKDLGIPLEQMGLGLPPRSMIDKYFEYNDIVRETSGNSAEAKLYRLNNPNYQEWGIENYGWSDLADENKTVLQLKVNYKEQFSQFDAYGDKASEQYIEDSKARAEARGKLYEDNPKFYDAALTVQAYSEGYSESNWGSYVEFSKLPTWGGWRDRYLMGNKNLYEEYISTEIGNHALIDFSKVKPQARDETYMEFLEEFKQWDDIGGKSQSEITNMRLNLDKVTKDGVSFYQARYRVKAYDYFISEKNIDTFVEYYTSEDLKIPEYHKSNLGWYEDDWYKMEHPEFTSEMVAKGYWQKPDFSKVPSRNVYSLWVLYNNLPTDRTIRKDFRLENPSLDDWLVSALGYTPATGAIKNQEQLDKWTILAQDILEGLERSRQLTIPK